LSKSTHLGGELAAQVAAEGVVGDAEDERHLVERGGEGERKREREREMSDTTSVVEDERHLRGRGVCKGARMDAIARTHRETCRGFALDGLLAHVRQW
jgi:hypothetical protein